ncbi:MULTISPECIES: hypothetical protein [unclassified Streptomyces]|uniref:hypothetical protein n=1 Tax=unclassified Streptomyces TaxID=2593676 RepID=UPI002556E809|nr:MULTISPECIES: hypothetical protein [unclassified Streptomyces]WRZ65699.1 hypothetical protein OG408_18210 [Streptomyces sp. NBC_01257]
MFTFTLREVTLCSPEHKDHTGDLTGLPSDLHDVIGTGGDQFRDWFTRLCLYLVLKSDAPAGPGDDTVVIGTEYGNSAALARLQQEGMERGRMLSAQVFPNATSGSASAFTNIKIGAKGRNMTLNAGRLTPVMALWETLSALATGRSATSHVLVGDTYSAQALEDVRAHGTESSCRPGVVHARFERGDTYTARFDFAGPSHRDATDADPPGGRDRNGAFAFAGFLTALRELAPGASTRLECRDGDRRAAVTVTHADTTGPDTDPGHNPGRSR